MQYQFGSGLLTLTPTGTNPTPIQVGTLQDVSVDLEFATKELRGSYQFPVALARTTGKVSGSAKFAQISGLIVNQFLSGSSIAGGQTIGVPNEVGTIPATPYQVTVANNATWVDDLGVYDVTSQKVLTRVASAPATGQYSVAAGVYTFAAADTTHKVWISYTYTVATGKTVTFTNQPMGQQNTFAMTLFNQFGGKYSGIKLYAVVLSKLTFPFKNEDFVVSDTAFDAFADSNGAVIDEYTAE